MLVDKGQSTSNSKTIEPKEQSDRGGTLASTVGSSRITSDPNNAFSSASLPPSSSSRSELQREMVAQLRLPRVPSQVPFSEGLNRGIEETERKANEGLTRAREVYGELRDGAVQQYRQIERNVGRAVEDLKQSPVGQGVVGTFRAVGSVANDAVQAVQSGRAQEAIVNQVRQIPDSIRTVMSDPKAFIRDLQEQGPQIVQNVSNRTVVEFVSRMQEKLPEGFRDRATVRQDDKLGWVVTDGTVVIDLGDGRGGPGVNGIRLRREDGTLTPPVVGRVEQDPVRGPVVVDERSGGKVAMSRDGLVVREGSGWSAPMPGGVRAELTERDAEGRLTGRVISGVVVTPPGATAGERVLVEPGGQFRVESSGRQGYSMSYSRGEYTPVVLEGRVWAQSESTGALVNTDKKNEGLVRLRLGDGVYSQPLEGRYTTNTLATTDGRQAAFAGVELQSLNGKPVEKGAVIALGNGMYRTAMSDGKLSGALPGTPAQLDGQWGIVQQGERGEQVFISRGGLQVKSPGAQRFTQPVPGGEVVYVEGTIGVAPGAATPAPAAFRNGQVSTRSKVFPVLVRLADYEQMG